MATTTPTKLVTYEEWLQMPEVEDQIEEVVDGEIFLMPPKMFAHLKVTTALRRLLDRVLDPETFLVVDSSFGLVIRESPLTTRVPDLAVFIEGTMVVIKDYIHSAPELAVEVLSPSNTRAEMHRKLLDYASLGIPEVWIASPEARTIEVLHLEEGAFKSVRLLSAGTLAPKLFPEAVIEVSGVWPLRSGT